MANVTKKAIREVKMNELARYFNATEATKVGYACRGDWRGTTDYRVRFNTGVEFFITNGMKRFDEGLDHYINIYKFFTEHKAEILNVLNELAERDAAIAREKGFTPYEVVDVNYVKGTNWHLGWFYMTIKMGDIVRNFVETGFHCAIRNTYRWGIEKMREDILAEREYFVAGGIPEDKANFVVRGVGFATDMDIYVIHEDEV